MMPAYRSQQPHSSSLIILIQLSLNIIVSLSQDVSADFLTELKSLSPSLGGAASQNKLVSACQQNLDFASIREFRDFVEVFKSKNLDELRSEKVPSGCLKHREAILELENLVQIRDVCDPSKIDALVDYHERHFARKGIFASTRTQPIMHRFFSKYAIQVAYVCKKNLLRNLDLSRDELQARSRVFEEAREKIFRDEPTIKSNIKLIENQPDEPTSTNVKPKDKIEMSLNEYRDALTKLRRPEDILTFDRRECVSSSTRRLSIANDKVQTFFKPSMLCLQLARYYGGTILSIAKLANIGYIATDDELDVRLADDPAIKDWVIATQVCEPMLYMRSEKVEGDVAIIDTCSERVVSIETMAFDDHFDELDNELLVEMLPKSEATRNQAQKIMKAAMKKMARVNLMKELKSGKIKKRSIFSKNLNVMSRTSAAGDLAALQMDVSSNSQVSRQLLHGAVDISALKQISTGQTSDEASFEELMKVLSQDSQSGTGLQRGEDDDDSGEGAVRGFDPLTSLFSTLIILAIMLTFEWLFFIVMTLAARICHRLHFHFDNLLTFPPKVLSWSDAGFTKFNSDLEKLDEDDFFDYDELNPDEQKQRDMLAKVFGKPPPMLFRE